MRYVRWLDHVLPWASWGALAASGGFSVWEMFFMALPLAAAAIVEAVRLKLSRWRRLLEIACLFIAIVCRFTNLEWMTIVILLLFMLCAIRLSLPREQKHRRQIIFIAFLLFMLTTVANTSISFLPWTLIWTATAALALLQLNWENAANLKGTMASPPLRYVAVWIPIAALIGGILFIALPRPFVGWRPMPFGINGFGGGAAGLADSLSLEDTGSIQGNSDVVARILPPPDISPRTRKNMESRMALLIGFRMEHAKDGRWELLKNTPVRWDVDFGNVWAKDANTTDYFVYPNPTGLIAMPQGRIQVIPPVNVRIVSMNGGAIRWSYPLARPMPFKFKLDTLETETVTERQIKMRGLRTPDPVTIEALHWSLRVASGEMRSVDLANLLSRDLQTFQYSLDNPSGGAENPLG
ncbi:MAG: DUF3488 domain-containing protein, partial [Holophagales bacterium]|nr:DUF3488 domain-containing protein [Holophagales bacterium]